MPKIPCSELQKTLADLAMLYAAQGNKTLAKVVEAMQKDVNPALTREIVSDAIHAATTGKAAAVEEIAKVIREVKAEARTDATLRAKISAANKALAEGTLPTAAQRMAKPPTEPIQALRELRDELNTKIRQSEPAQAKRLQASIDRLAQQIDVLDSGQYVAPEAKDFKPGSKQLERLAYERDRMRAQVRDKIKGLRPKSPLQRVGAVIGEPMNILRAIMTGGEFSAVLRQGAFVALGHPVRAAKALPDMFRAFASPVAAHRINTEILDRPNAPLYDRGGLYLAPESTNTLSAKEEVFMSRLADKIPLIAGSQRAYNTFLNRLRADSFDQMAHSLAQRGEVTGKEAETIGNYINAATGRGKWVPQQAAAALNTVFFSPRYFTSRVQLLSGEPLYGGTARTRKMIATEYAKTLTGLAVVYSLGKLGGAEIEDDPHSSAFGKLKFGNTYVDPLAGLSQLTVFGTRMATGETKNLGGKVTDLRDAKFGQRDIVDVGAAFVRSKLAPVPGAAVNLLAGKDMLGQPVTFASEGGKLIVPMTYRDIYEGMVEEGMDKGTALGVIAMFGAGIQTVPDRKPESR